MSEDTKFPNTFWIRKQWVKDWFKQCMEDSPIIETKYGLWEEWYNKWFNQFETSQTEEQKDV